MKIALQTPQQKRTAFAIVILLAVGYTLAVSRLFVATWLGSRVELASLQWAARLDSGNADYRNHLGRFYALVQRDPASAVDYYKQAVQLNPHSARYWFDLASAYQVLGDTGNQTSSLEHAIEADAMTPDVAWEAANVYLVQGQNDKALHEFRVVMANDPSLAGSSIRFCWRIDPDVDSLLRDVVPNNAIADIAFLNLLETQQEVPGSFKVWDALMQTHEPFELYQANDYLRFLFLQKQVDEAVLVWRQTAGRFGLDSYLPSANNLIVNPMFNLNILNAGFDWQYQKQQSVTLTLDPSDFHAGRRSLLISFDGPGINDAGIYQLIAVQPNTTYDFTGYYKNGEIEGAGGPHLTIQDMYSQKIYFQSDELKDAPFWKSADGEFTTDPDCKLVILRVHRLPEGSPIRGKLWIDDFHLARKPA
jgi:tetratricopeptide (TPR) repeat protein